MGVDGGCGGGGGDGDGGSNTRHSLILLRVSCKVERYTAARCDSERCGRGRHVRGRRVWGTCEMLRRVLVIRVKGRRVVGRPGEETLLRGTLGSGDT